MSSSPPLISASPRLSSRLDGVPEDTIAQRRLTIPRDDVPKDRVECNHPDKRPQALLGEIHDFRPGLVVVDRFVEMVDRNPRGQFVHSEEL